MTVPVKVEDDFLEGPKSAQTLEVRKRHGHFRLVIVILIQIRSRRVQSLRQLLIGVRLSLHRE